LHKLSWSRCKCFTIGHRIAGTVLGIKAAIPCGDELWFSVSMEVSEQTQNLTVIIGRNEPAAHLKSNWPLSADLIYICFAQSYNKTTSMDVKRLAMIGAQCTCPNSRTTTFSDCNKQSKLYQNFYQSNLFSSVVKSGMPLNQL